MDRIKKIYDRFTLAVISAALLAVALMMFMGTVGFTARFKAPIADSTHHNTFPAFNTAAIESARQQLENPTIWKERDSEKDANGGLLFTSQRYQSPSHLHGLD